MFSDDSRFAAKVLRGMNEEIEGSQDAQLLSLHNGSPSVVDKIEAKVQKSALMPAGQQTTETNALAATSSALPPTSTAQCNALSTNLEVSDSQVIAYNPENSVSLNVEDAEYQTGDHVYRLPGVLGISQQHGVILEATKGERPDDGTMMWRLKVAEFYPNAKDVKDEGRNESDDWSRDDISGSDVVGPDNPAEIDRSTSQSFETKSNHDSVSGSLASPSRRASPGEDMQLPPDVAVAVTTVTQTKRKRIWHKVTYEAGWWHRHMGRSGSCTAATRDGPALVRARLQFILELQQNQPPNDESEPSANASSKNDDDATSDLNTESSDGDLKTEMSNIPLSEEKSSSNVASVDDSFGDGAGLSSQPESTDVGESGTDTKSEAHAGIRPLLPPRYHWIRANSECLAVWCLTGTWATLQASSWLSVTAAGQVKSAATLVTVAGSTTVTVPAAGLWGFLGYTTKVSLLATNPIVIPAIGAYGAVTVGAPLWWLHRAKKVWKQSSMDMNTAFWEWAEQKEGFVDLLMEWSS